MKLIINGGYLKLMEETLSDGSKVYNISTDNGRTICLTALTEAEAAKMFTVINQAVASVL